MVAAVLNAEAERELAGLHEALQRYHQVSGRDVAETLARKANDIRIQLFRGYWEQRWKGARAGAKDSEGIAFRQMRLRAKNGQGVTIRPLLTQQAPSTAAPVEYFQRRKLRGKHGSTRRLRVPVTMSTYQRRVWTELARRQSGIGVLGVAFLAQRYRKRYSTSASGYVATGADRLRANRAGFTPAIDVQEQRGHNREILGRLTLAPKFASIEGFVPGHATVGAKRGILAAALSNVRADVEVYLRRKAEESIGAEIEASGVKTR